MLSLPETAPRQLTIMTFPKAAEMAKKATTELKSFRSEHLAGHR